MTWLSRKLGSGPKASMPRRLLLMLRELHLMGYERLRCVTGLSPSGCHWRLQITPAIGVSIPGEDVDFMARHNRGVAVGDWLVYARRDCASYSTGSSAEHLDQCFGWTDAVDDTPCRLAGKFIDRFPTVVAAGKGSDPEYADWYANMIEATGPEGLIYMYADWEMPSDHIPVLKMKGVRVPPPPRVNDADT